MGLWFVYFAIKLYLSYNGALRFDVPLNLLFLAVLLVPLPGRYRSLRLVPVLRTTLCVFFGILLVWHDSWLPGPLDAVGLLRQYGWPSKDYIVHFFLRFYSPLGLGVLALGLAAWYALRNYSKVMTAGIVVLAVIPLFLPRGDATRQQLEEVERAYAAFQDSEMTRIIPIHRGGMHGDFDIIILHVCSMAWDDLRELQLEEHRFFQRFDLLFTNFNSATTYSNPAVIRLLNANCGQRTHDDLYTRFPKECSIMENLRAQGFEISFVRNHNGQYGNFDEEIRKFGQLDAAPFQPAGLSANKFMFDRSPVYGDHAILAQWLGSRRRSRANKVALYYNSVSLHDGTHRVDDKDWWKKGQKEQYREFLKELLGDMERFFDLVASSKRNTVIVFVPEHGRAVRGSAVTPPGLRDIPLPRITTVPVGIALIGTRGRSGLPARQQVISKPVSYLALSEVISAFLEQSPFLSDRHTYKSFLDNIPETEFVAENQQNIVVQKDGGFFYRGKDDKWILLSDTQIQ